ncbi:hypothetical protein MLPF_2003 [Mycobacterium lepromatosis]|nr:hypothetical protein MLPF_2003 [Mycobacterium lepromatosis]
MVAWCSRWSRMLLVCSGRNRSHCSKGRCEAIANERYMELAATKRKSS